ncbi:DUF4760 domain-containing protein [Nocardioides aquiterrae]|uniref:DUF4760 domain-containing protein n=1 Tax=Nocardioides aquiterrae TaxID=203799 RepID=A0ABN1UJV8_9ACTN
MDEALPWISLGIALFALTINGLTFRDRRRQDRRDLFLKMHERLIDQDLQRGRRLLYQHIHDEGSARRLRMSPAEADAEIYQAINRALAMFDVFSMYVEKGYIDRAEALQEWGHTLARAFQQAQPFIADRDNNQTWLSWPNLRSFGQEAVRWHEERAQSPAKVTQEG